MKVGIGYPDEEGENNILLRFERDDPLDNLEQVVEPEEITQMQDKVREINVEVSVRRYLVQV